MRKLFLKIKEEFNPQNWTLKTYLLTALGLLSINAFGPQGIIQYILLSQEKLRLETVVENQKTEITGNKRKIRQFKNSDLSKLKIIRQELGLLKPDEISIEIIDSEN